MKPRVTNLPTDDMSTKLRKQLFAKTFMTNGFNGTKAAIAAGYAEKNADKYCDVLLKDEFVQGEMQKIQNVATKKMMIDHNRLIQELKTIAYSSAADIYNDWTDIKKFDEISEENKKCIAQIETKTIKEKTATGEVINAEYIKIKFHDKLSAIDKLAKHIGLYEVDNSQKNVQTVSILLSSQELIDQLAAE